MVFEWFREALKLLGAHFGTSGKIILESMENETSVPEKDVTDQAVRPQTDRPTEVTEACKELNEENVDLVRRIFECLGADKFVKILKDTKEIQAGKGLKTADGSRNRTAGGVFLFFASEVIGRNEFNRICSANRKAKRKLKQQEKDRHRNVKPKLDSKGSNHPKEESAGSALHDQVKEACTELNENNKELVAQIHKRVGSDKFADLVKETLSIEASEGMKTADGSRRRTPGGVFMYLASNEIGKSDFNRMCSANRKAKRKLKQKPSDS
mmetsp:Transcript_6258/g.7186  ORF Transcript_6258/g.7186 Transcript_6258/m.7186 type:complete len:268 (+) Transcript_6258:53-856(+)